MKDTELAQKGYLDCKDAGDEGLYNLIRQGGVVCLGILARHLHGDLKRVSSCLTSEDMQSLLAQRHLTRANHTKLAQKGYLDRKDVGDDGL